MDDNTISEAMNVDESQSSESNTLKTLNLNQTALSSSLENLSSSSATLPSSKDFHFFYNFDQFKLPVQKIAVKSQALLDRIGEDSHIWVSKSLLYPAHDDKAYDWLVEVNDEFCERFDESFDELEAALKVVDDSGEPVSEEVRNELIGKEKKKGKIPFHIGKLRKPQEEYNILVNNSNEPFEHVWLKRTDDGKRFIHPLEMLSVLDFVDKEVEDIVPIEPPPTETTPFKLVEEVRDLKEMANKSRAVNEFAVDLEHNQYRSFQGLTCLMQISTRTEDFVVDTLKLWIHVGPYLRDVFKDPAKKKVMHGADRDIIWLQRDFGIYVCNMFDTGQASRVLKLERNSLEHLLRHYCGVTANKEYQNADWRLRPLPDEMLRYARDDTHYLLYIYDLMRKQLSSEPKESESSDTPLIQVYKRSYDICMQLYEKEIFTESSYLQIRGLQDAGFNPQQLAVFAGLYEWRDVNARAEDESTGYILPNKALLEIAKYMPVTISKLRWLVKSKHPYVERNLVSVVSIIRHSMLDAAAYEAVAECLKNESIEMGSQVNSVATDKSKGLLPENHAKMNKKKDNKVNVGISLNLSCPDLKRRSLEVGPAVDRSTQGRYSKCTVENGGVGTYLSTSKSKVPCQSSSIPGPSKSKIASKATTNLSKDSRADVHLLKNPSPAFGKHLGSSSSNRKPECSKRLVKKSSSSAGEQLASSSSNRSQQGSSSSNRMPESSRKSGAGKMCAALDAMRPFGFADELVHQTVAELLSVYGEEAGWPFLEEASYTLLVETLLEKQNGATE